MIWQLTTDLVNCLAGRSLIKWLAKKLCSGSACGFHHSSICYITATSVLFCTLCMYLFMTDISSWSGQNRDRKCIQTNAWQWYTKEYLLLNIPIVLKIAEVQLWSDTSSPKILYKILTVTRILIRNQKLSFSFLFFTLVNRLCIIINQNSIHYVYSQ